MKKKFLVSLLTVILAITAVCPYVSAQGGSSEKTQVTASVDPMYAFTLPSDATIPYPQTETLLGQFGVRDLLLRSGEELTLELATTPLQNRDDPSAALPCTVTFSPPSVINGANIGDSYDLKARIKGEDFLAAKSGTYQGLLTVSVRSSQTGAVVFSAVTAIVMTKSDHSVISSPKTGETGRTAVILIGAIACVLLLLWIRRRIRDDADRADVRARASHREP